MNDNWIEFDKKLLSDSEVANLRKKFQDAVDWGKKAGYTNDKHQKELKDNSEKVASIRGGIINSMVDFEHFLCIFLSSYFCENWKETEFYENILAQDFFTTYQKIKLFQRVGYHKQKKYKGKYNGLSGIMLKLNELRNLVAHGTPLHFTKPELGFPYSGKATHFDDNLAKRFGNAFEQAYYCLSLLDEDLKEEKFKKEYGRNKNTQKLSEKDLNEEIKK